MGRHAGISPSTVQRIWVKNELKPHITRTFTLSNDKKFEEKFWDVIGLYLDPPEANVYRERQALTQGAGAVLRREESMSERLS
jgi:hypothetical protein